MHVAINITGFVIPTSGESSKIAEECRRKILSSKRQIYDIPICEERLRGTRSTPSPDSHVTYSNGEAHDT